MEIILIKSKGKMKRFNKTLQIQFGSTNKNGFRFVYAIMAKGKRTSNSIFTT